MHSSAYEPVLFDSIGRPTYPASVPLQTYEMKMFHSSSLKLGLDQAVLHGFEQQTGASAKASTSTTTTGPPRLR